MKHRRGERLNKRSVNVSAMENDCCSVITTELCGRKKRRNGFVFQNRKFIGESYFDEWSPAELRANIRPVCAAMN